MKKSTVYIPLIAAIIASIMSLILTGSWKFALISAIPVFILVLWLYNRSIFIRAFWTFMAIAGTQNKWVLELSEKKLGLDLKVEYGNEPSNSVFIVSLLAALVCLILHFLDKNKGDGTLFSFKKNQVGDINGKDASLNQTVK